MEGERKQSAKDGKLERGREKIEFGCNK